MLVASEVDYFKQAERPEIERFLNQILTRLEIEWMIEEAVTKINTLAGK